MVSQRCLVVIKYILFLFNLLFCILGALLLSLGIWIVLAETSFFMPAPPHISFSVLSYFFMFGGSVTMLLGFFGCLGALKEVKCMLGMFFFLLSVLLAAQIVGAVLLYTQKTLFASQVEEHVIDVMTSFRKNESNYWNFKKTLDYVQQEMRCCGWSGPNNWVEIPCSCYQPENNTDLQLASNHSDMCDCHSIQYLPFCEVYGNGCREGIAEWLDNNWIIIYGVLLAVMTVEVMQIIYLTLRQHKLYPGLS
ncbi:leukocyte antigen CD37 isoform X2 [Esox lucius]|uniref:leukocyte antigen CD37 isoform X2 n=1 Tax=Esox lucius TaxID=8010 RepID=UPI0005779E46|nr:leukocyte antigen CD37 isoform X2 [Esox lucius]